MCRSADGLRSDRQEADAAVESLESRNLSFKLLVYGLTVVIGLTNLYMSALLSYAPVMIWTTLSFVGMQRHAKLLLTCGALVCVNGVHDAIVLRGSAWRAVSPFFFASMGLLASHMLLIALHHRLAGD